MSAIIAVGGTGGHVLPGYNLAEHFIDENIDVKLITDKRGFKYIKNYKNLKVFIFTLFTIQKKKYFRNFKIYNFNFSFYSEINNFPNV